MLKKVSKHSENINKLYEYSPMERLASIKSTEISQSVAKLLNDKNTEQLMILKYYREMLRGYNVGLIQDKTDSPTKFYLECQGALNNWHLIEELSQDLASIERIKLGLKDNDDVLKQIEEKSYNLSFKY